MFSMHMLGHAGNSLDNAFPVGFCVREEPRGEPTNPCDFDRVLSRTLEIPCGQQTHRENENYFKFK